MEIKLPIFSRSCGDCTKCCEGWLEGVVYGHKMYRGCNCHFLESSCKIYEDRPDSPCKSYNCAWLQEEDFPGWMKPNLSSVIITKRSIRVPSEEGMKKVDYYDVIESGRKMDSSVLNWLVHWSLEKEKNIAYELDGKVHALGSEEFKNLIT